MVLGPVPTSGSSPGLPLTLDNSSCTPTPNPTNPGDVDDGRSTTQQSATNLNNNNTNTQNNNLSSHHSHHSHHTHHHQPHHNQQQSNQDHHHHHHHQHPSETSNDQSLIILQPSGVGVTSEIGPGTAADIGGYSSMLPSFSHYAPGKFA